MLYQQSGLSPPPLPQVNIDDEGGEEEMEWLMEELEAPPPGRGGKGGQENGHITTKPVNADALRSFTLDEQEDDDSEDEVLSVPGVRVMTRGQRAPSRPLTSGPRSALLQEESDEDLVGLLDDSQRRRSRGGRQSRPGTTEPIGNEKTTTVTRIC